MKTPLNGNDRPSLNLTRDCVHVSHEVHTLVAAAFLGSRPEGLEGEHIRHLDDDKTNNASHQLGLRLSV